jgi:hypothetical protein
MNFLKSNKILSFSLNFVLYIHTVAYIFIQTRKNVRIRMRKKLSGRLDGKTLLAQLQIDPSGSRWKNSMFIGAKSIVYAEQLFICE